MEDEKDVIIDTPIDTVEETEETPAETEEETQKVDVAALEATNKKLYERTKKAEAELKALKGTDPAKASPQLNVEETVLLANGMPDELLSELKVIAQVRKVSLIKAQNDPIFVAVKEKFEADKKREISSTGAARGAGAVKAKKDFNTPGLSREEHRAMVLGK